MYKRHIPTTQVERQLSKQVDGPRNIPDHGLALGYNVFRGTKKRINMDINDRRRHMYIVGQTGVGKSSFLENLAVQDMLNGDGFAFIDPHGDTAERLLNLVPKERTEDVIYFSPADTDFPLGLNLFEFDENSPEQKDFLIQESLSMLYKLYDPQKQGIIGPRFERIFTNAALLLMADPKGGTFVDIPKLLIDPDFMKEKLPHVTDQNVLDFWTKEWPNSQRSNEAGEVTSWVVSKFGAFLSNEMMRNIIGQTKSSFDMREIMDNKKILLVNLSKGRAGEINSKLLGMIFVMKFQAAAMSRANSQYRPDFCLYVDEFQNYSTDSFADILSEARKFGLNLIVANQFTTQLTDEIRDAVFGNVGTIVSFRVGTADAEMLEKQFRPVFDIEDLQRIPNYNAVVRTLIGGVPTQPFSMSLLPYIDGSNQELGDALKQLSAAKFGRPKAVVEKDIFARLKTNEKKPARGAAGVPGGNRPVRQRAQRPSSGSSFLDDWLNKKQQPGAPRQPRPIAQQPTANVNPFAGAATQTQPSTPAQTVVPPATPSVPAPSPVAAQATQIADPPLQNVPPPPQAPTKISQQTSSPAAAPAPEGSSQHEQPMITQTTQQQRSSQQVFQQPTAAAQELVTPQESNSQQQPIAPIASAETSVSTTTQAKGTFRQSPAVQNGHRHVDIKDDAADHVVSLR